jgi:anaerobic ribonucleoside-triphosphate reductase
MQTSSSAATQTSDGVATAQRTKCEVWTRVMGYHRPVQNFNVGKKSEHYSRAHFSEATSVGSFK